MVISVSSDLSSAEGADPRCRRSAWAAVQSSGQRFLSLRARRFVLETSECAQRRRLVQVCPWCTFPPFRLVQNEMKSDRKLNESDKEEVVAVCALLSRTWRLRRPWSFQMVWYVKSWRANELWNHQHEPVNLSHSLTAERRRTPFPPGLHTDSLNPHVAPGSGNKHLTAGGGGLISQVWITPEQNAKSSVAPGVKQPRVMWSVVAVSSDSLRISKVSLVSKAAKSFKTIFPRRSLSSFSGAFDHKRWNGLLRRAETQHSRAYESPRLPACHMTLALHVPLAPQDHRATPVCWQVCQLCLHDLNLGFHCGSTCKEPSDGSWTPGVNGVGLFRLCHGCRRLEQPASVSLG